MRTHARCSLQPSAHMHPHAASSSRILRKLAAASMQPAALPQPQPRPAGAHSLAGPRQQRLLGLLEKLIQPGILADLRSRHRQAGRRAGSGAAGAAGAGRSAAPQPRQTGCAKSVAAPLARSQWKPTRGQAWEVYASSPPGARGRRGSPPAAAPRATRSPPAGSRGRAPAGACPSPCGQRRVAAPGQERTGSLSGRLAAACSASSGSCLPPHHRHLCAQL